MSANHRKVVYFFTVYVTPAVLIFSIPLQVYIFDNINYLILGIAFIILGIEHVARRKCVFVKPPLFIYVVLLWIPVSLCLGVQSSLIPIVGSLSYIIPYLYYILLSSCFKKLFSLQKYIRFLISCGVVMALFGLIQRFISNTMFGMLSAVNHIYTEEAILNADYFRISSLFQSPQTYGVFIGMTTVLLLIEGGRIKNKSWFYYFLLFILLLGGFLSGSQIYALIFFVFIMVKFIIIIQEKKRIKKKKFLVGSMCVYFAVIVAALFRHRIWQMAENSLIRVFRIFLNHSEFTSSESKRFGLMTLVFKGTVNNSIMGYGLGTSSYLAKNLLGNWVKQVTTESFFMSCWYEMGVLGALSFGGMCFQAYKRCCKSNNSLFIFVICFFVASFFSPALYVTNLYPLYIVFFDLYYENRDIKKEGLLTENTVGN